LAGRCFCFAAMSSMSSDFVMLGLLLVAEETVGRRL
jgi:hypothetical protein